MQMVFENEVDAKFAPENNCKQLYMIPVQFFFSFEDRFVTSQCRNSRKKGKSVF